MKRRMIVASVLAVIVSACPGRAEEKPQAQEQPAEEFSAWFRFETVDNLGRSTGQTPWPALAHAAEWIPWGKGRFGGALNLPGVNGNGLYLPNPASFFGETARQGTVALWVRGQAPPKDTPAVLFDFMVSTNNTRIDGHQLVMFIEKDQLVTWPALQRRMTIPNPIAADTWTHVTLTWNCQHGTTLYVNGAKAAEKQGAFEPIPLSASWPGRIGAHSVSGRFPFAGEIDELRLFNTALSPQNVAALHDLDATLPPVEATLDEDRVVQVTNAGQTPIAVTLDRWLPARSLQPPWYGFTPAHFNRQLWTAGHANPEMLSESRQIPPGQSVREPVPYPRHEWGPGRIRLLVGTGLATQEVALAPVRKSWLRTTQGPPRFGLLDRRGLYIDIQRSKPVVFPAGRELVLPLVITNDMARAVSTTLNIELLGRGGKIQARRQLAVTLDPGETITEDLPLRVTMGRGRFNVRITIHNRDRYILLQQLPVFGTDDETAQTLCAVGAAYTGKPDDEKLLKRMASDGISLVRLGGKRDGASFRHNLSTIMAFGMKVWRTPAFSYRAVCANPKAREKMAENAAQLGQAMRDNRAVVNQSMAGEGLSYPPCYCEHCNRHFREWLRERYRSLSKLNRAWKSNYENWHDIEQLGSPDDVDMAAERLKMMQVALELPKDNTERWIRLFELDRPRAMDWRRWHDDLLLAWYRDFANAFRARNGGTVPVGEQPCWPNFKTHVFFPLATIADMGGMDLYLPGEMKTTLGYAAELFLNFDMNASLYSRLQKPVMVHELYVQDRSPEGLAEAQGWWLVGRGYDLMTYFTYPYYHEGTRAGEPLIFGMFDKKDKPYPVYRSFKRFSADLFRFNARYTASALRRAQPRIAIFLGDDMSIANILESGGATWNANGVHGHNGAYWLTQRNGLPVEFINDRTFELLDRERVLIVPWSHAIRKQSIDRILKFAKRGGHVIIDGPFAQYDGQYRQYETCPGGGAAETLGVRCTGFDAEKQNISLPSGARVPARGRPLGLSVNDTVEILCRYDDKRPAVVRSRVGSGNVTWALSALGPEHRSRAPHPETLHFWRRLIAGAGISPRARLEPKNNATTEQTKSDLDHAGKGIENQEPCLDVAWRIKDDKELFVFSVSFFQTTAGILHLHLPHNRFAVRNAITGEPLPVSWEGNTLKYPLELSAFGASVVHISALDGDSTPFETW